MKLVTCQICGKEFERKGNRGREPKRCYECAKSELKKWTKDYHKDKYIPRRATKKYCKYCGEFFFTKKANKYCSDECLKQYWAEFHKKKYTKVVPKVKKCHGCGCKIISNSWKKYCDDCLKERNNGRCRTYYNNNKEKLYERQKKYAKKNRKKTREGTRKRTEELTDGIVRRYIVVNAKNNGVTLSPENIPQDLIELKRKQIELRRKIKNLKT